ncbi:reverse transcriptase [Gossypium australe]|uniref:Reverse transcriptase n=1 Tax=Gossypium australe TaxID=47621 RepID=A0A5B6X804_9ROSI|nr:reverse transcriptase [Gossypium australe]
MIHDNVLIAHELVHYLHNSKNGPNKGCVVKLDMNKAYDQVEWRFLEKVLLKFGFGSNWVTKIMNCVRTVRYRVKCNMNLSNIINPERGLRQGDPLSPYLFLFCMEVLSRMLINAQEKASRNGPRINHLFFADDALLFVRNNRSEVEACKQILETFEKIPGQSINLDKSMICLNPNTPISQRTTMNAMLKMKVVDNLDGYLGLPIPIGKKKYNAFKSILNRTANRINSWSKRLLSNGGKEIFIKSILQSIPTYAFSVFLAPKGVLEEIQSMISRVWWSGGENKRGWNMMAQDRICLPKSMGALVLGIFIFFNVALLGRQVCRLYHCKDTLCFKVLSAKYFPDGDIFHSKKIDRPSFTWQSITKASSILSEGFGWNVGNGRNIDIWNDNWGFEGLSGSSILLDRNLVQEKTVSDLRNENKDGWKDNRVLEIYGENMGDRICKIPIIHDSYEDQCTWFHNPNGVFSSKSTYSWLILKQVGFGPHRIFWRIIWKLKTLPKIRIFGWRMGHDILPTYEKIASIRSDFNSTCPRCGKDKETLIHAMKDCPKAKAVLEYGGFNNSLLNAKFTHCVDWIEEVCRVLDKKAVADFITVLWNIWNNRNNKIFGGTEDDAKVTWEKASVLSHDFWIDKG